jgi:hypothetical protein
MSSYNPSEANLPKWAQQEFDKLRNEVINLRASESARLVAHVVRLDNDWFVMPGPSEGQPAIRLWTLTADGPKLLGTLANGQSLMFQQAKEDEV